MLQLPDDGNSSKQHNTDLNSFRHGNCIGPVFCGVKETKRGCKSD
jgi:hypothetical protein